MTTTPTAASPPCATIATDAFDELSNEWLIYSAGSAPSADVTELGELRLRVDGAGAPPAFVRVRLDTPLHTLEGTHLDVVVDDLDAMDDGQLLLRWQQPCFALATCDPGTAAVAVAIDLNELRLVTQDEQRNQLAWCATGGCPKLADVAPPFAVRMWQADGTVHGAVRRVDDDAWTDLGEYALGEAAPAELQLELEVTVTADAVPIVATIDSLSWRDCPATF